MARSWIHWLINIVLAMAVALTLPQCPWWLRALVLSVAVEFSAIAAAVHTTILMEEEDNG